MATTDQKAHKEKVAEAKKNLRAAEKSYGAEVDVARDALEAAQSAYQGRIRETERAVEHAKSKRVKNIANSERALAEAQAGKKLTGYANALTVYENRLETSAGTTPLAAAVRASVEVSGQKAEKSDSREVLLMLDTPDFDHVIRCSPDHGTLAREVAAALNTAAKNAKTHLHAYEERRRQAEAHLHGVKSDAREVDAAAAALTAARSDTSAIQLAQQRLDEALGQTDAIEAARRRLLEIDPTAQTRGMDELKRERRGSRVRRSWSRRSRRSRIAIVGVVLLVLFGAIGAFGDTGGSDDRGVTGASASEATETTGSSMPTVALSITKPAGSAGVVRTRTTEIRGFATPDARVSVNGEAARRKGARFWLPVRLKIGSNALAVKASKAGFETATAQAEVVRRLPSVDLVVQRPQPGEVIEAALVTVVGRSVEGAAVTVNGKLVGVGPADFSSAVDLDQGVNTLVVRAAKKGYESQVTRLRVTRRLSEQEIAAAAEQRRQAFINSAQTIPYSQLIKNPDAYAGQRVKYYGEILQVQESTGAGIMLLFVTNLGYDVWSNQIWVNYTGSVRGAQGDKLTVYGTVLGSRTYKTQIGGETYVPEVDAVYIVE